MIEAALRTYFRAAESVDSALAKAPLVRNVRGVVLDILFGPAEDFDYVSRTTPRTAPPPPR